MKKQQDQRTAKKGKIKLKSKISVTHVLWRILKIILFLLVMHIIGFVALLVPLVGLFISAAIGLAAWLFALNWVICLIMYCCSKTVITTDGIYGRDKRNKKFDVCFDQIQHFERSGTKIIIGADVITKKDQVKRMQHVIPMINSVEFEEQYQNR